MASAQPGYPPNGSYYHQNQASQSSRYSSLGSGRYHTPYRSPSVSDMRGAPTPGVHPAPSPGLPSVGSFRGVLMHPNAPGARAWDEYYMKGGTDPAGLVYYYPETVQDFPQSAPQAYPSHMSDRPNERAPYPYQGHQHPPQHHVRERVPSGSYHHHAFQTPHQHPHHAHSQSLPVNTYPYSQPQQPLPNHQPFDVRPSPVPQQPPSPYGHQGSWPPPQSGTFVPSPISNSPMNSPNRTPSTTSHQLPPTTYDSGINSPHPGQRVQPAPSPSYQSSPLPLQPQPQLPYQGPPQHDAALTPSSSNGSILSSYGSGNIPKSPGPGSFSSLPSTSTTSISSAGSAGSQHNRPGSNRPLPNPVTLRSATTSVAPGPNPSLAQGENGIAQPRQPFNPEAAFAAVRARQAAAAAASGRPLPGRSSTLPATPTPTVLPPINRPPQLPTPGANVEGRRPLPSPVGSAPIDLKGKGKAKETEADVQAEIHRRPLPSPIKGSFSSGLGTSPTTASPIADATMMSASSPATERPSQRPPLPPVPTQQPKPFQSAAEERAAAAKAEAQRRMQEKLERIRNHRWKEAGGEDAPPKEPDNRTTSPVTNDSVEEAPVVSRFDAREEPISTQAEATFDDDDWAAKPSAKPEERERSSSPDIPQPRLDTVSSASNAASQSPKMAPKLETFRRPLPPRIKAAKPESEADSPVEPSPTKPDPTPTPVRALPEPTKPDPSPTPVRALPSPTKPDSNPGPVRSLPEKPSQQPSVRPASAFNASRPARSPSAFGSRSQSAFEGARPSMTTLASASSVSSTTWEPPKRLSSPPRFTPSLPESNATSRPKASDTANVGAPVSPNAVERPSYGFKSTPSTPGLTEGAETVSGPSMHSDEVSTQAEEEEEESSQEDHTPSQSRFQSNGRALPTPPQVRPPPATPQREVRPPPETSRQRERPSSAAPRHSMVFRMALEEQEEETRAPVSPPSRNSAMSSSSPRNSYSSTSTSQRTPSPSETPRRQLPQPTRPTTTQRTPNNRASPPKSQIDLDDQPPTSLHRNGSFSRPTSSRPASRVNGNGPSTSPVERAAPTTTTEAKPSAAPKRFSPSLAHKAAPADDYTIPTSSSRPLPSKPPASSFGSAPKPVNSGSSNPAPVSKPPAPPSVPVINFPDDEEEEPAPPVRSTPRKPSVTITSAPTISVEVADDTAPTTPSRPSAVTSSAANGRPSAQPARSGPPPIYRKGSLRCAGCDLLIVGKIVSAMDRRWHPACFKCSECSELLEHVSSYEHNGKPYCHLDYHDLFAPKCYHCKTAIADERFITVNDPGLDGGDTRYYHELHFFCAECGDPFLHPSASSAAPKGQKPRPHEAHHNDLGYTVYRGHAYCEACHVRLRMPKCTGCKKSIRDEVVEALGGKWHFHCFVCKSCKRPFEDPSFFQRGDDPYCDLCYSILIKSEL
ncbi:hypothetical protein FS837_000410 [Tulasnella sp. UAMH 9824]|nr:hypothetical protein FS837_000410 [Tulasnella sp. UAMH 9824]